MKTLFFFIVMIFVSSFTLIAQDNLSFSKVIQTDSVGKATIFATINEWFATTYNSANDVLQMIDKEAGIITGNGLMAYDYGDMFYGCYTGNIKYTIKVYVKDNRYKVEITNFNHSGHIGTPACSLGLITNREVYTTSGMYKKSHNKIWNEIKVVAEQYSNTLFNSLENKTKKMNVENLGGDW